MRILRPAHPSSSQPSHEAGHVSIVGAGPGAVELLTLKAARLISEADVIVYDHLVGQEILDLARPDAQRIYAGKEASRHTMPQSQMNQLLVDLAKAGKTVVRLKGGDPFIFGRGGEEIEALVNAGISFDVTPGITAASGCAAYAGIPLTHRDHAQICIFATGHLKDNSVDLDWPTLARPNQTIVFYMGVGALPEICRQMIAHGLAKDTPAAIIQNGARPDQRVLTATLDSLAEAATRQNFGPPALIIVGSVVTLYSRFNWTRHDEPGLTG